MASRGQTPLTHAAAANRLTPSFSASRAHASSSRSPQLPPQAGQAAQSQTGHRTEQPRSSPQVASPASAPPPTRQDAAAAAEPSTDEIPSSIRIPRILPHERVFPIQIGSELFKLSGASLCSDAPSYFSQYFRCQLQKAEEEARAANKSLSLATGGADADTHAAEPMVMPPLRTLYIDRDPVTFRDISLHLQGYHVQPRDGTHFVRLFADAQFYSLPRLVSQLFEESIFISIGHREFQIPRDVFQDPGNSPNFFTLGFAIFFSNPQELFPGLKREGLIRPPSILPPAVPNRSADTFAELLHLLRGNPVEIRSEEHRQTLLRDCRYFNFKGLEQRLLPHSISYNQSRHRHEITLRLEDIFKSGISIVTESTESLVTAASFSAHSAYAAQAAPGALPLPLPAPPVAWIHYARPFVDDRSAELVLEIGSENTHLHFHAPSSAAAAAAAASVHAFPAAPTVRAEFLRDTKIRIARLFEVIATKLNLPPTTQPLGLLMVRGANSQPPTPGNTPLSEDHVRVLLEPDTAITLDGEPFVLPPYATASAPGDHLEDTGGGGGGGAATPMDDNLFSPASSHQSIPLFPSSNYGNESSSNGDGPRKRRRTEAALSSAPVFSPTAYASTAPGTEWTVRAGQWRLRIQPAQHGKSAVECVLVGVRLDAATSELARNRQRTFLGG